jgi:hypothetical protein
MRKFYFCLFLLISSVVYAQRSPKNTVSGYVREAGSQELLPGVTVWAAASKTGTSTNTYGFYSLTLPASDSLYLSVSCVGYQTRNLSFAFRQSVATDILLSPSSTALEEVEIKAGKPDETERMGVISVPISQIKEMPGFLGEKDVMKVLQLMPGVKRGTEGTSGLYVRGGGTDQNLLILDDAIVYNASHLFGFFSTFNGDALKSVELTKGGFPARYGGRLSSVVDMQMREGNKEKLHGEGGIGILSSRLLIEAPLKKNKSSFIFSGRRTYLDVLLRPVMPTEDRASIYFYDANAKINYDFGRKNRLYLSGYFGKDNFASISKDGNDKFRQGFNWGNATATLRWNHLFNEKLFSNAAFIFSKYNFEVFDTEKDGSNTVYNLNYSSGIRDFTFKYDFDFLPNPKHTIKAGLLATAHRFTPSAVILKDIRLDTAGRDINRIDATEIAVYAEDAYQPFARLRINAGLRYTYFRDNLFTASTIEYFNPEPRLSVAYQLPKNWTVKASYATMNQYLHLLSNSGLGLPTDLWVPATRRVPAQRSAQVALGLVKDFVEQEVTLTFETYYKKMNNIIAYKEGASFLLLEIGDNGNTVEEVKWEDNVTVGQGWAYGGEILLQKKAGRLSGWVGYTLAWIEHQFDEINFGEKFFARYDRRHDVSVVGIYKLSPKITLSGTWVYGTGNALTIPTGEFTATYQGFLQNRAFAVRDYGKRNAFRAAPYHRLDFGIQFRKQKRWGERVWDIGFYNAYARANPFFYDFKSKTLPNGQTETVLTYSALFPIIPSLSYNFKF